MQIISDTLSVSDSTSELKKYIDPFSGQTAISILSSVLGLPIVMIDLGPKDFSMLFPKDHIPPTANGFFRNDLKRYRSWRLIMLDMMLLVHRTVVDEDPRDSLIRACRLLHGETKARRLYQPVSRISFGDFIKLDLNKALEVDSNLSRADSANFRAALSIMDMLRNNELVIALGLLGLNSIGPLPDPSKHLTHCPFQPKLAALYTDAPKDVRAGLPVVWRLGCLGGVFKPDSDVDSSDLTDASTINQLLQLDPATHGFDRPRKSRYDRYVAEICNYLELGSYRRAKAAKNRTAEEWYLLFAAISDFVGKSPAIAIREASRLAIPESLCPTDLNPLWFRSKIQTLSGREFRLFRQACYALDECRSVDQNLDALLPKEPTGIQRVRNKRGMGREKRLPVPRLTRDPILRAWEDLFMALIDEGYSKKRVQRLQSLRSQAVQLQIRPSELTIRKTEKLKAAAKRKISIGAAQLLLDEARQHESLLPLLPSSPLGKLVDQRRTTIDMAPGIEAQVGNLLTLIGYTESSSRAVSVAIKALFEISGQTETDLNELLGLPFDKLDWGKFSKRSASHIKVLSRVRYLAQLPWTPTWRELQTTVLEAGITPRNNPVPNLLAFADGRSPQSLDLRWAQDVDRKLRRTTHDKPHGRADLAFTFARNVGRIDDLHSQPTFAASHLLPPAIGTIRK